MLRPNGYFLFSLEQSDFSAEFHEREKRRQQFPNEFAEDEEDLEGEEPLPKITQPHAYTISPAVYPYAIQYSGRWNHHSDYIRQLLDEMEFEIVAQDTVYADQMFGRTSDGDVAFHATAPIKAQSIVYLVQSKAKANPATYS